MAAVTICSDFGAQKNKAWTVSTVSPSISHEASKKDQKEFLWNKLSSAYGMEKQKD